MRYHLSKKHTPEDLLDHGVEAWFYNKKDPDHQRRCIDWLYEKGYIKKAADAKQVDYDEDDKDYEPEELI